MKNRYILLFVGVLLVFCNTVPAQTSRFDRLSLTGGFNGWRADGAQMRLVADNTWETEIYLWDMPQDYFKFVGEANWVNTNVWGDSTQSNFTVPISGIATFQPGSGGDIRINNILAGFFRFRFNDLTREYSISQIYTTNSGINLIDNPAFMQQGSSANQAYNWENGNPDYHGGSWGHVERRDWGGYSGNWHGAIEAKWGSGDDDFGGWWQEGPAIAGYNYEASCWVWADNTVGTIFEASLYELKIEFFSSTYEMLSSEVINFEHNGQDWTRISLEALAPPSTAWARFVIYCGGMNNQGALRFDNVQLRQKASRTQDFNNWTAYTNDACHDFDWKLCEGKVVSNEVPEINGQLIISEYIEGSSYNKAIELYNGTDSAIDLGAGNYSLLIYNNGSVAQDYISALTGVIQAASAYVLVSDQSLVDAALVAKANERPSAVARFNGNDAIELRQGGATGPIIDSFGQVGNDPGSSGWGGVTTDHTLQRNSSITSGRTNSTAVFDPFEEWTVYPIDDFTGLGSHTMTAPDIYTPSGVSASIAPGVSNYIQSGQIDGVGNITFWYRALTNTTPMTYDIQTSDESGTNWITRDTLSGVTNVMYTSYLLPLYEPDAQYMRILHTAGSNRLIVDDVNIAEAVSNGISRIQNFNTWTNNTSYGNHTNDSWVLSNGRSVSNEARTGFCGWLVTNSYLQSPYFEDGAGIIDFWYKRDNNSTNPVRFEVQYSTNGSDWTTLETFDAIGNDEYEAASVYAYIQEPVYIRFAHLESYTLDPVSNVFKGALLVLDDIQINKTTLYTYQDFNKWPTTSYGDSSFQGWSVHEASIKTDHAYDGKSAVMKDTVGDHAYLQSPYIPDGLGTLSFQYARWHEGSPYNVYYDILFSEDGTTWYTNDNLHVTSTTFQVYEKYAYTTNMHYFKIVHTSGSEQVIFDNINIAELTPPANVNMEGWHTPNNVSATNDVLLQATAFERYDAYNVSVTGYYRIGTSGAFSAVAMVITNGSTYSAVGLIPSQPSGSQVQYYMESRFDGPASDSNSPAYWPTGGPTNPAGYYVPRNPPGRIWINEINYLNEDWYFPDDTNEFVEICGPEGWDISNWRVEFYIQLTNSYTYYASYELPQGSVLTNNPSNGFGFFAVGDVQLGSLVNVHFDHTNWFAYDETDQISNGEYPSGLRLLNEGGGFELSLSYRGSISGFERMPLDEDGWDPDPTCVILSGTGGQYDDFTWVTNDLTPNSANIGQTLIAWSSPTLINPSFSNIVNDTGYLGAKIMATNGSPISERGVYWSRTNNFVPPNAGNKVFESGTYSTGLYSVAVSGLPNGTNIYFRAYAVNGAGTGYTEQASFATTPSSPTAYDATNQLWSSFNAHWSTVGTASNYLLDVAEDSGFSIYLDGYSNRTVGNVNWHMVTGLVWNSCEYYYRVRAQNTGGSSTNSNIIIVTNEIPPAMTAMGVTPLTNAGFENDNFDGWTVWGGDVHATEDWYPHSGEFHAKVWGNGSGSPSYTGFYQDKDATAGQVWRASMWAMSPILPTNDIIQGNNKARIEVVFLNSSKGEIASYSSPEISSNSILGIYYQLSVIATSPLNTAYTRIRAVFVQATPSEGGAAFFDDAMLAMGQAHADTNGTAVLPDLEPMIAASNNCPSEPTVTQLTSAGTVMPMGTGTVQFIADGCCDLSVTSQVPFVVCDVTGPTVTPPADIQVAVSNDIPAPDTDAVSVTDNDPGCSSFTVWHVLDRNNGGAGTAGDPLIVQRIYAATDCTGNPGVGMQIITVSEGTGPTNVAIHSVEMSTTNMVIRSTGTNTFLVVPEFTTNLLASPQLWIPIPIITNIWDNGTNITTFGLPDTNALSTVIRILQEQE